ncbi:hypothetical protein JHK86_047739 [Glycine max]|nr:hypothetical protein JHK86_047739 [Glycine max]
MRRVQVHRIRFGYCGYWGSLKEGVFKEVEKKRLVCSLFVEWYRFEEVYLIVMRQRYKTFLYRTAMLRCTKPTSSSLHILKRKGINIMQGIEIVLRVRHISISLLYRKRAIRRALPNLHRKDEWKQPFDKYGAEG